MTAFCFFLATLLAFFSAFHFAGKVGPGPTYTKKENVYGCLTIICLFAVLALSIATAWNL
jgi:hypothetical protein